MMDHHAGAGVVQRPRDGGSEPAGTASDQDCVFGE